MERTNRLIDYYLPPGEGFSLESLVATTYQVDFEFVEEELLAVALGVRSPISRLKAFRSELERKLQKAEVSVLYDLSGCDRLARLSPRIDAIPIVARKLHSKISLLMWVREDRVGGEKSDRRMRLIVGSANLTRQGFRQNYECVVSIDFGGRNNSSRSLLTTAIGLVQQIAGESKSPQLASQLAAFTAQANLLPDGTTGADDPLALVAAPDVVSTVRDSWAAISKKAPETVTVVSPFWAEGTTAAEALSGLFEQLGPPANLELVCRGEKSPDGKAWLPVFDSSVAIELKKRLSSRLCLCAALPDAGDQLSSASPEEIGDETEEKEFATRLGNGNHNSSELQRALHAKMILVDGSAGSVLYAGSSNCTRRGLGLGGPTNSEAGFVYRLTPRQRKQLVGLLEFAGPAGDFTQQIAHDCARQSETASAILRRFFGANERERRELMILADEVGLGKTYVGLAVAVSMLDAIRRGASPDGLPANKPVVLVLTPTNDALFNKWMREAEAFKQDCARHDNALEWLQIRSPIENSSKSGNAIDLTVQMRDATRAKPMLLIAKQSVFGAALHDRDRWRKRGLAAIFRHFHTPKNIRRIWCRKGKVFDKYGIPELSELLDLRSSGPLWDDPISPDLERAFSRAMSNYPRVTERVGIALNGTDEGSLSNLLDDLARFALVADWPQFPLVIIDEIHGFKNQVQSRRHLEAFANGKICRLMGLSATPFQLRHDELLSLLKLRGVLSLPKERFAQLDEAESNLRAAMEGARDSGEIFRRRWKGLQPSDQSVVADTWTAVMGAAESERQQLAVQIRPPRVSHAIIAAMDLERRNAALRKHLRPIVIRHQHPRGYREHFVGNKAASPNGRGSPTFSWSPGMDIRGDDELAQYLMMRAVALAKDEKGLPSLGAELTGSYRHLVEMAAVWKKLARARNPLLRDYRAILEEMIGKRTESHDPDTEHRKVQATVQRALEFFKRGQKSLVFCVYTKTAETVRDQLRVAIDNYLGEMRDAVFGNASAFENFRRRFFNRREALFSLIQDHPLLGTLHGGRVGVPSDVALTVENLRQIGRLLVEQGQYADSDKPDRRLLMAATEQVAVNWWREFPEGEKWLEEVLQNCPELEERIVEPSWLEAREPLSRSERAGRSADPEANVEIRDPLEAEEEDAEPLAGRSAGAADDAVESWVRRLREDAIGQIIAPYFRHGLIKAGDGLQPLLAEHHQKVLAQFDMKTRAVAGQVFRRILMADEFLIRYLAQIEKDNTTRWAGYLSKRYVKPLDGHLESLRDRVNAYLETLVRARKNHALLSDYHAGAENRNVVQLVKGDTQNRDRYFLGFNTPYRPEILVSTSVGQEGIDLHRECRHVIHHDLCWNPATIEQRTGRVDRIGSKVERERMGVQDDQGPTLEIAVPYLAATYDERMFEELYRRAQLFEVTLGGEMRVEGRIDPEHVASQHKIREKLGIGTDDEVIGVESDETGVVDLPADMIERLRVDLSVWKPKLPKCP